MSHPVLPELPGTKPSTKEYTSSYPCLQIHRQQRMALLGIKGRKGPWSWKGSILQCRGIEGQGSRRGLIGNGREDGLWDNFGGEIGKGKSFEK